MLGGLCPQSCVYGERQTMRTGNKASFLHVYHDHVKEINEDAMILGQEGGIRGKEPLGQMIQGKCFEK